MEIVIEIPDGCYEELCNARFPIQDAYRLVTWIKEGTPLPKGHGDLIDRKELIENGISKGFCDWYDEIKMADTIIEADRGE